MKKRASFINSEPPPDEEEEVVPGQVEDWWPAIVYVK